MTGRNWWAIDVVSSLVLFGFISSSGIVWLAHRFVNEFTHSHVVLDDEQYTWDMPLAESEPSPAFRRPLSIHTCDGKRLSGEFWAQPHPAPTIILCHGYRVPQVHLHPVAALEYRSGYNILLFDFRGHGESARAITSGGNAEVPDLDPAMMVTPPPPQPPPAKFFFPVFFFCHTCSLLL